MPVITGRNGFSDMASEAFSVFEVKDFGPGRPAASEARAGGAKTVQAAGKDASVKKNGPNSSSEG